MNLATGRRLAIAAALVLFVLPIALALPLALREAASLDAWRTLADDPQTLPALRLSIGTALASTLLALLATLLLTTALHASRGWGRVAAALPSLLALPHAAFAIGLAWLVAPAGWLARLLAPLAGWEQPPAWPTVSDPQGFGLVLVLFLKELPFLLWNTVALLARPEVAATLAREQAVARTLGYAPRAWWWRVGWRQWLPRLAWPLLAVLAYSLTVVDLALIVGPASPPTLAVLAWQHLADGNPERSAQGAAAAVLLSAVLLGLVLAALAAFIAVDRLWRRWAALGHRPRFVKAGAACGAAVGCGVVVLLYAAAVLALAVMSAAGAWPFPSRWPLELTLDRWRTVAESAGTVAFSALLAVAASSSALVITVGWLEATPARWDGRITPFVLAPLVLPQLLLMAGLYQGALRLGLDGSVAGLCWVHMLMVLPYSWTTLAPAWRCFDPRFEAIALTLGRRRLVFWWRVKWPLLAAPLASTLAVGFAVSIAQYLATQFIGAGRHATLTTEAVTLASGGQRTLAAAFALMQALLPLIGFVFAAAWANRALRKRQ